MAASGGSTGPLADALETAESGDPGPVKKTKAAMELVGRSNTGTEGKQLRKTVAAAAAAAAAAGEGSSALPAVPITNTPPLPPRFQPIPTSGKRRRISKLHAKDPRGNLPTVAKPKDPYTAESVASSRDKLLVRDVARSTVSVCSIALDGKVAYQCTGIFISWKETKKCARILTSYDIVPELEPNFKLHICLPNRTVLEGQLLFFNEHYGIALLEILSESDLPLELPSFGSNPNYGQEVFILARGEESNLMARHGRILWFEAPKNLNRNHLMFLSCETPMYGTGGPVVDHDGSVAGMAFDDGGPNTSILAISSILTCTEMWMKFSWKMKRFYLGGKTT